MDFLVCIFDVALLLILDWFLRVDSTLSLFLVGVDSLFLFMFRVFEVDHSESFKSQFLRILISLSLSGMVEHMFLDELVKPSYIVIRVGAGTLTLSVFNHSFRSVLQGKLCVRNYVIVGNSDGVEPILEEIAQKSNGRYRFIKKVGSFESIGKQKHCGADKVLIVDPQIFQSVRDKVRENNRIDYFPHVAERVLKRIPIEVIDRFKDYYENAFSKVREPVLKRLIDILCSIIGLIVFSPLMLFISLWILIEDGRPVVFKQWRIGKDGKPFLIYKFRTMKNEFAERAKFVDEEINRLLKIGKIIRPFRLDECVQFLNILRGDMSVVGPRPEQVDFVREFGAKIPYYFYRHKLKPGLTGWAQIMYKYASSLEETKVKLSYDLYYIKNRTLLMDLKIILQTVEAVLWRRGAK